MTATNASTPGVTWEHLQELIEGHHHADLVAVLGTLDDPDRKRLTPHLKRYARPDPGGFGLRDYSGGLALTGAAVLPDARTTASWLRRHRAVDFVRPPAGAPVNAIGADVSVHSKLKAVLIGRSPTWLDALLAQCGANVRFDNYDASAFEWVEDLRTSRGLAPFQDPTYVGMWAYWRWLRLYNPANQVGVFEAEPALSGVVPLLFEIDDVAARLRDSPTLLASAITWGGVDRHAVLDAGLARLSRGGRPQATNDVAAVVSALEMTLEEAAARTGVLLGLLSGTPATVATLAQRLLLQLDGAGQLAPADLQESCDAVFARTDKKLVRTHLAHLQQSTHRTGAPHTPGPRALIALVAPALRCSIIDVQRDATALIGDLLQDAALDDDTVALLAAHAAELPPDLAGRLAIPDTTTPGTDDVTAPEADLGHVVPTPAPVVPISSSHEAVEVLLTLVRGEGNAMDGLAIERYLEAVPRLNGTDPEALRRAGQPALEDPDLAWARDTEPYYRDNQDLRRGLVGVLAAALGSPLPVLADELPTGMSPPQQVLARRTWALVETICDHGSRVRTVSLPSWDTGALDDDTLQDRLNQATRQRWHLDPVDLEQARLRGATSQEPDAARWPTTRAEPVQNYRDPVEPGERHHRQPLAHTTVATFDPGDAATDPADPADPAGSLVRLLTRSPLDGRPYSPSFDPEAVYTAWPLLLPHHPEVVAAHLVPEMARGRSARCAGATALLGLARAHGTVGDATYLCLLYGLAGKEQQTQAAAIDAALILTARDRLDPSRFGALLADLLHRSDVSTRRVVPPLRDLAAAGATATVWDVLRTCIETLLDPEHVDDTVAGLNDLLSLAAEVATAAQDRGPAMPGLAAFAARKGHTRQLVEARRLHDLVTL